MRLLLDADALIKLNGAGVLVTILDACDCLVPDAVYAEVVTDGRARRYEDAAAIEAAILNRCQVVSISTHAEQLAPLGRGEQAVLNLTHENPDAIVISDDRRFLSLLGARSLSFLTPSQLLVTLTRERLLSGNQARVALERMRPSISPRDHLAAVEGLDLALGESNEEN